MSGGPDFQAILCELVAVKRLRDDIARRKQRRENGRFRNPEAFKAIKAEHAECMERERKAWRAAMAAVDGKEMQ